MAGEMQITLNRASYKAEQEIQGLLDELKKNLLLSVEKNLYDFRNDPIQRHKYLLLAAKALGKYGVEWELIAGRWSENEIDACVELAAILASYELGDLRSDTIELLKIGPTLGETGRNRYAQRVADVEREIRVARTMFGDDDYAAMLQHIQVLQEARARIRRNLLVEDELSRLLLEIGDSIAYEMAENAIKVYQDSPTLVWPYRNRYAVDIEANKKRTAQELSRLKGRHAPKTFFDEAAYNAKPYGV